MTQTTYQSRPDAPTAWLTTLKVLVAGGLVTAGIGSAAVAGFLAAITHSGCFLSCGQPNRLGGVLLGLLALALLLGGVALSVVMWRRARTLRSVSTWAGVVLGLPVAYLVLSSMLTLTGAF